MGLISVLKGDRLAMGVGELRDKLHETMYEEWTEATTGGERTRKEYEWMALDHLIAKLEVFDGKW